MPEPELDRGTTNFVRFGAPEALLKALQTRFNRTGPPLGLKLFFASAQRDGRDLGLYRLALGGLVDEVLDGHWSPIARLTRLAVEGRHRSYNLPKGLRVCPVPRATRR